MAAGTIANCPLDCNRILQPQAVPARFSLIRMPLSRHITDVAGFLDRLRDETACVLADRSACQRRYAARHRVATRGMRHRQRRERQDFA
jgi:hypothetical protein